uniref:Presenilin n=1 Tax=Kalanchoe fedtschenkoi TaxID=63787 RepID=A0A7N1A595_KALFE
MEGSILESIGVEIIGVMSPVSICMLLVVLLVYTLTSPSSPPLSIRTAANLVYLEKPSDPPVQKLEGSIANAIVFIALIAVFTFLLVALYYYNFTNFLKNYMRFSAFFVFGTMGGLIFSSVIQHFSIPVDPVTFCLLLFNFTVVGVLSMFSAGMPILVRQSYMVILGIIVAAWFTKLPEWNTWTLLVALALYDIAAVLAPRGPLKLLVELASTRDEELPALVYEARPVVPAGSRGRSLNMLVCGVSDSGSVEMQNVVVDRESRDEVGGEQGGHTSINVENLRDEETVENTGEVGETSPLVSRPSSDRSSSGHSVSHVMLRRVGSGEIEIVNEERSPLMDMLNMESVREPVRMENDDSSSRGIKLGLGDFIFYSVLVGRAAMYDLMTVYACYLGIISGLGCTLILLSVFRRALPALPISIILGVIFYFLTRLFMEPFVVGMATNLMMF